MTYPNPIELLLDPISLTTIALYAALILLEAVFPARKLPAVRAWKLKGIISFLLFFYISSYLPMFIGSLATPLLFDLSGISIAVGAVLGILLYEFSVYLWHRQMHRSNFLWKTFHQMHHSAERLDTYGAFYFSPLDMAAWTLLGTICFSFLVGLPPQSITITFLFNAFLSVFQHSNIRTPIWLGYIIQRPESHTYHHARNIHRYNYSDLPIFDMLFGSFHNPAGFEHQTGFYHGASARIKDMLLFRDISKDGNKKTTPPEAIQPKPADSPAATKPTKQNDWVDMV